MRNLLIICTFFLGLTAQAGDHHHDQHKADAAKKVEKAEKEGEKDQKAEADEAAKKVEKMTNEARAKTDKDKKAQTK